jgi:hypothetical protein
MKLKHCVYGVIVIAPASNTLGMVVGLTNKYELEEIGVRSNPENAIPLVQFSGEVRPRGIHQGNIEIYKGDL